MDSLLGSIDPYILIECGNITKSTEKISDNVNPVWF